MEWDVIKKLINLLKKYTFVFNEDEVKYELFHLLKEKGFIVRAEYPKKAPIHDLAILDDKLEIIHPIEIKSRENYSLKRTIAYLGEDVYGGCESSFIRKKIGKSMDGTYIFINNIESEEKSIMEKLSRINVKNEICKEYFFISVFYIEFIARNKKPIFNGCLKIKNGKIESILQD